MNNLLMHSLPLAVVGVYFGGFVYLWYLNARGR